MNEIVRLKRHFSIDRKYSKLAMSLINCLILIIEKTCDEDLNFLIRKNKDSIILEADYSEESEKIVTYFGKVLTGQAAVSELTQDKALIMEIKQLLDLAALEFKITLDFYNDQQNIANDFNQINNELKDIFKKIGTQLIDGYKEN